MEANKYHRSLSMSTLMALSIEYPSNVDGWLTVTRFAFNGGKLFYANRVSVTSVTHVRVGHVHHPVRDASHRLHNAMPSVLSVTLTVNSSKPSVT